MVFIISKEYKNISEEIGKQVFRGVTGIYSKGMYTNEEKMMLMCVASRREIIEIKRHFPVGLGSVFVFVLVFLVRYA